MLLPRLLDDPPAARLALRHDHDTWTYATLAALARAHAASLLDAGVAPGDHVAVWAAVTPETVVALVANALAGFVSVPLNPAAGARELEHVLRDAAPRVIVGEIPPERAGETPVTRVSMLPAQARAQNFSPVAPEAPVLILYTSGTTGAPKGAVLTHGAVAANLDALARAWDWSPDDVLVHALPFFHVHGLALGLFGTLRHGASLRLLARFDPALVTRSLAGEGTMFFGVPTMYHRLVEHAERSPEDARALARARLLVSGSAGLPVREHRRVEALTGRGVLERYGLTETLINTAVRAREGARPGYVGRALDGVSVRLVDDQRRPIDARDDATPGEVAVRGPNVFHSYLHRPEATESARDAEGWFYTGDLAVMADDGAVRILGRRATDLIKTGGYKVGAGEVESALLEHPAVCEAAVRGVADDDLGERIEAWVVLREGQSVSSEALTDHVASLIAWHKRPRRVHVVDALPRNAMGKVIKARLTP